MARVICPFCCRVHDFSVALRCPTLSQNVPAPYIREYSQVPPLWLLTVGFKKHGKTTYLAALTLLLENMGTVLEGMWYRPLDSETFLAIQEMRRQAADAKKSEPTPTATPRPLLFQVRDMPEMGSRCLVLYDVAGESFDTPDKVGDHVPALRQVNTVWFLVSLADLEQQEERRTITDLFNVYLSGMEDLKIDVRSWNLIVVYTKSDASKFPPEIKEDYLMSDPFTEVARAGARPTDAPALSLPAYLEEMKRISARLEDFTRSSVQGGAPFISMVRAHGMNLVFSLTSALGQSPDQGSEYLGHKALPYRILDPFLWAMMLERKKTSRSLRLVLDASPGSDDIYRDVPITDLWDRLADHGEVTTHFLGQVRPASMPGQPPPRSAPGRSRQRLIGPILQQCAAEDRVLVISSRPLLDLEDFRGTDWRDRLLLVSPGEETVHDWTQTLCFRQGDDVDPLIDCILRF